MSQTIQQFGFPGYIISEPRSYVVSTIDAASAPFGFTFFNSSGNQIRPTYVSMHIALGTNAAQHLIVFSGTKEQPNLIGFPSTFDASSTPPLSSIKGFILTNANSSQFIFDEDNAPTGFGLFPTTGSGNPTKTRLEITFGFIKPISHIRSIGHPGIFKNA